MIVITGATGALNGATVDHLLSRVPASRVAVAVREPARAQRFADLGVEVRRGDYAAPASLLSAFQGAEKVLLVSASDPGADALSLHRTAIAAAVDAGVGRILYTSHQGAAADSPFAAARVHAATEQLLQESGVAWTSLRNGFYAHSLPWLIGPWRESGVIAVPADGPVSWTSRDDEAEGAAVILASNGGYDGPTTLTAPEAPTFQDVAKIASDIIGSTVERVLVDPEEWVAQLVAAGEPEGRARFTLGIFQAAGDGFFAGTDPLLAELLGRAPRTVRQALEAPTAS